MANASVETFADDQVIFRENVSRTRRVGIEGNPGDMDFEIPTLTNGFSMGKGWDSCLEGDCFLL